MCIPDRSSKQPAIDPSATSPDDGLAWLKELQVRCEADCSIRARFSDSLELVLAFPPATGETCFLLEAVETVPVAHFTRARTRARIRAAKGERKAQGCGNTVPVAHCTRARTRAVKREREAQGESFDDVDDVQHRIMKKARR